MEKPIVSVLLPVRNGAAFIAEAVESILDQTFVDLELLVIDDASEDETPALLAHYADPRLRVLRNTDRLKLAGSLNRGLREARGAFIARMDADDVAEPERLGAQVSALSAHPDAGMCGTAVRLFDGASGIRRYPSRADRVRALSLFHSPFAHPTVMIRRAMFDLLDHGYDVNYYPAEDYELWVRLLRVTDGINLRRPLLRYRVHAESMTGGEWDDMDAQSARIARSVLSALGISVTDEVARFHRAASMGQLPHDRHAAVRLAAWLRQLQEAAHEVQFCGAGPLRLVLHDIWLRHAMASVRHAPMRTLRIYLRSRFCGVGSGRPWDDLLVVGAAARACLLSRREAS